MFSKVVILGSGNVATQLAQAFFSKGIKILQVYSRSISSARELAERVNAEAVCSLHQLTELADLYILAVSDTAIPELAGRMPFRCSWLVHTAGSVPLSALADCADHTGVLYPYQTLSRNRVPDVEHIPFFVEASTAEECESLSAFAGILSKSVFVMSSEKRSGLHLAAVFASNFVNHFYAIGASLLEKEGLPFSVLLPLMEETFRKAAESENPSLVQTGPAVRRDREVIEDHIKRLKEYPDWQKLYIFVTESILKQYSSE